MKPEAPTRPKQDTPQDLVDRLMATVRGQFCADLSQKEWCQQSHFIKRNVILWPARQMTAKGFTVPAARYEEILRGIFADIKNHGRTDSVRYWPGYLMYCVQQWWAHNWEDEYNRAKSVRNAAEMALLALGKLPGKPDTTVEALATTQRLLAAKSKARKRPDNDQLTLL